MKILTVVCTAAFALGMAGCNGNNTSAPAPAPDTHDADVKAISDTEAQWLNDWGTKDADKIAAHYADDAVLMSPGIPVWRGKNDIRKGLEGMLKDSGLMLSFKAAHVDVSGPLGYTQGSYTLKMTDPKTHKAMEDHGSYVTTYRKQADGTWKAVMDISTSEVPSMPMPAKKM